VPVVGERRASSLVTALGRAAAAQGEVRSAEARLVVAVAAARAQGASWRSVGTWLGMTGEGARKRFADGR